MLAVILRAGFRSLSRNRLRSTLTVLGIMVGAAAILCVEAIADAGSAQVKEQLTSLGDNLIWIEAGSRAPNGVRSGTHGTSSLTMADAEAIRREVPLLKSMSPQVDASAMVVFGNQNWTTQYRGVSPEYFQIRRWSLETGAAFTDEDVRHAGNVCVLGETVRQQLFGTEEPVGQVIRVKGLPCQVSGVLAKKGVSATGQDQDDTILLPYTTAQKKLKGISWVDDVMCSAKSADSIEPAVQLITGILSDRHHINPGQDLDFNIRKPEEQIEAQLSIARTFSLLLVAVAFVSLLVGGIGIMNVMLVSVAERTREIGIRMAVGATQGQVQLQFLFEAVLLSLFGGTIGILLGSSGSALIGRALGWPMHVLPQEILVAAASAAGTGIIFGYYPARRAAQQDPIQALRWE